ncbi:glycoside hydrolase family 19 protein [Actinoplanes sp. NEAU-A12]|uniref:Glycoside hydrolase family 19 protein n=1 Tax=Actinoplanes sandaracinus TaxID=3045177 RepID=A0ABT6WTV1_9ACTN|nr:glycoside hydrolase family 19 protein [Actinoplanes sandaracinus]MDI6103162.1 glycoside hydrolase family 19 protein [Actinoplanes sandaracinus]
MPRKRLLSMVAAVGVAVAGAATAILPMTASNAAEACAAAYHSSTVYTGGTRASFNSHNWTAKWWTQGEAPSAGGSGVWSDNGACGGGTTPPPGGGSGSFPVSEAQFHQMFPNRIPFYSYAGLIDAIKKFPAFTATGSDTVRKQEAAAFLANVNHESGGLVYVEEINQANWPLYCDRSQPYGCPAGQSAYHGRGPIQLSWNFNYKAAGDALGIDLLNNPDRVKNESSVAYQTAIWYWMTQRGPGTMTPHDAMVNSRGFGETIRSINGSLECNGGNPAQVQSRINAYHRFTGILGVAPGGNLSC